MTARRRTLLLAAAIAILVAITVWARLPGALDDALWADEVYSARTIVAPSAREALYRVSQESSPPGWFFLGRVTHLAGVEPQTVRLWSVIFSALLTVLVVIYARRFLPVPGALLAGLLIALAYPPVFHGKELRPYALLALLALVFVLALEAAAARPSRWRLVALASVSVAGAMTHYFFLFPVFIGVLWLWAFGPRPARFWVTGAAFAGLVPLLVWIPKILGQAERVDEYIGPIKPIRVLRFYQSLFASPGTWERTGEAVRFLVLLAVLAGTVLLARKAAGRLTAMLILIPVVVTALVSVAGLHVFANRNLIVVAPFACIALAALPSAIPSRALALAAMVAVAAGAVWSYSVDRDRHRTPFDRIGETIADYGWTAGDPVVLFGKALNQKAPLGWYLPESPQLQQGRAREGDACERAFVVAQLPSALRWLDAHPEHVLRSRTLPYYGVKEQERQPHDLVVAEVRWSDELVAAIRGEKATVFFPRNHAAPRCVRPLPLPSGPARLF